MKSPIVPLSRSEEEKQSGRERNLTVVPRIIPFYLKSI